MRLILKTAPTDEPLDLAAAKLWLKVKYPDEDALITELIKSARRWVENQTRRALLEQTWVLSLDCFPTAKTSNRWGAIELPKGKTIDVTVLTYYDKDHVQQDLLAPAGQVVLDLTDESGGRVVMADGESWPDISDEVPSPITVEFSCGYATVAKIPETLVQAARYKLSDMFDIRGPLDVPRAGRWEGVANNLVNNMRLNNFGATADQNA